MGELKGPPLLKEAVTMGFILLFRRVVNEFAPGTPCSQTASKSTSYTSVKLM